MKFKIQLKIGRHNFVIEDEAETMTDFVRKNSFYQSLPDHCGACGAEDIVLNHRIAQGFNFHEIACQNPTCLKVQRMGAYKDLKGELFVKKAWVEKQVTDTAISD